MYIVLFPYELGAVSKRVFSRMTDREEVPPIHYSPVGDRSKTCIQSFPGPMYTYSIYINRPIWQIFSARTGDLKIPEKQSEFLSYHQSSSINKGPAVFGQPSLRTPTV